MTTAVTPLEWFSRSVEGRGDSRSRKEWMKNGRGEEDRWWNFDQWSYPLTLVKPPFLKDFHPSSLRSGEFIIPKNVLRSHGPRSYSLSSNIKTPPLIPSHLLLNISSSCPFLVHPWVGPLFRRNLTHWQGFYVHSGRHYLKLWPSISLCVSLL